MLSAPIPLNLSFSRAGEKAPEAKIYGQIFYKNILRHSLEREVKRGTEKPSPYPSLAGGAKEESLPCEGEVWWGQKSLPCPR